MWSLIIIIMSLHGAGITHVDSFISKRLCEHAGVKMIKTMKDVNVQYACVLEIN